MRPLASTEREGIEPVPLRRRSTSGIVDAFNLDALGQDDAHERLAVDKWSVAKSVTENNGSFGKLKHLSYGDTSLKRRS